MENDHDYKPVSEFRRDLVSGDWILVAAGRRDRPNAHDIKTEARKIVPKKNCPFENPQESGNGHPVLWYAKPEIGASENLDDWFLQVIPNKFPVLTPHHICPQERTAGPYPVMDGVGFHEVIITRDHVKSIADMTREEIELVLRSYQERYLSIENEGCISYILVFHNHGPQAGASIFHPHSQLIALPIIPPDVMRSLDGARSYFEKHKQCAHCSALNFEIKEKIRIVYSNDYFVAVTPFAPHVSFEVRVSPREHRAHFEDISNDARSALAEAMRITLKKLQNAMGDPDYNFFIHTAPAKSDGMDHYHWHIEILPRTAIWAGIELGTGVEVVAVSPEEAAQLLRDS